jgi:TfoX/Sxy family transcriptional regulator of competence genes
VSHLRHREFGGRRPYRFVGAKASMSGRWELWMDASQAHAALAASRDDVPMAYDEDLANRIRELIAGDPAVTEQRMFGGLAFLVNGNMAVAASGQGGLMLRADPDDSDALVAEPHAGLMVMRGREMPGWLRVDEAGVRADGDLRTWVERGVGYARSLPPKQKKG